MYKTQMKLQKLFCYLALGAAVLLFVYSLGFCTDLYEAFYLTMWNPKNHLETDVPGSIIYYDVQPFNHWLTILSIVLILAAVFMFLMHTHTRRRYYQGNVIASLIYAGGGFILSVWIIIELLIFRNQFLTTVDFEALAQHVVDWGGVYTESTFVFDIGFVVCAVLIVVCGLVAFNLLFKQKLMKEEERLLNLNTTNDHSNSFKGEE